ncbi:MAG: tetratricopeptide repeat protein [Pirellulaceae bacterium]
MGSALFFQGKAEPAIASLEKAVVAESGWSQTDIALVMLARAQAKADQLTEAKATLTRLLENYPNSSSVTEAHYRLGEIAEKAEDAAEARRQYALVAAASQPSLRSVRARGRCLAGV